MKRRDWKIFWLAIFVLVVVMLLLPVVRSATATGLKDVGLPGPAGYVSSS